MTDLAGTVSMLYGMLLHQDAPMRDEKAVPPKLPPHTTAVAQITSQLLYRVVSCQCGNSRGFFGRLNHGLNHGLTHPQPEVTHL